MVPEVSNQVLNAEIQSGKSLVLIDVREANELANGVIEGSIHIPMGQIPQNLKKLNPSDDIVVICRSGGRSGQIAEFLIQNGFSNVRNLVGGMNAWAKDIDTTMTVY